MANKYEINEQTDLASLAKQVEAIAARHENIQQQQRQDNPVHDITAEPAARKTTARVAPAKRALFSKRTMVLGMAFGALLIVALVGALFGRQLFASSTRPVPDVAGEKETAAAQMLKRSGFAVAIEYDKTSRRPAGMVVATMPPAGQKLHPGSKVVLRIAVKAARYEPAPAPKPRSTAQPRNNNDAKDLRQDVVPDDNTPKASADQDDANVQPETPKKLTVPAVDGLKAEEARKALQDAGLKIAEETVSLADRPDGAVVAVDPKVGAEIQPGDTVRLKINKQPPKLDTPPEAHGPVKVTIPDYINLSSQDAVRDLRARGLTPEWSFVANPRFKPGTVIICTPSAGSRVDPGGKVCLVLAK